MPSHADDSYYRVGQDAANNCIWLEIFEFHGVRPANFTLSKAHFAAILESLGCRRYKSEEKTHWSAAIDKCPALPLFYVQVPSSVIAIWIPYFT